MTKPAQEAIDAMLCDVEDSLHMEKIPYLSDKTNGLRTSIVILNSQSEQVWEIIERGCHPCAVTIEFGPSALIVPVY